MIGHQGRLAIFGLVSLLATGCSFIAVRPVPTVLPTSGRTVCATYFPVFLDGVALPLWGAFGYVLDDLCITIDGRECQGRKRLTHYIPAMIVAASAVYGVWAVNHCNNKLEQLPSDSGSPFPAASRAEEAGP
jgi:hypothetical protein